MKLKWLVVLISILLLGAGLRLYFARFGILFEPDNYIYLSVAQQTLAHNLTITSVLSSVPARAYDEYPGLVLFPAGLAALTGISVFDIIMYVPVFLGIIGILLAYLLGFELSQNRYVGLFAAFLYAVLPAALMRSVAGEWRGEVFVSVFLGSAFYFLIKLMAAERKNSMFVWGALSALMVLLSLMWWSGGVYVLVPIGIFYFSFVVFRVAPKFLRNMDSNKRNRITFGITILGFGIGIPIFYRAYKLAQILVGGFTAFLPSFISELAPTSAFFLLEYFGWVFIAALLGLGIVMWYENVEKFGGASYALFALFMPAFLMTLFAVRWIALLVLPACVLGAYGVYAIVKIMRINRNAALFAVAGLAFVSLLLGVVWVAGLAPSDNVNASFISALVWVRNNTPSNAVILTMWPDGSVVEGVSDRTSFTDSVISQTSSLIIPFERFLYARAGNYSYLASWLNKTDERPAYLLARSMWHSERGAILLEAGLPLNTSWNGTNLESMENKSFGYPLLYDANGTLIYRLR